MTAPCPHCGCPRADGIATHAIVAAIADDDLDRAIDAGLLTASGCTSCSEPCTAQLLASRDARRAALAARERYRGRNARLLRRTAELAARRAPGRATEAPPPEACPPEAELAASPSSPMHAPATIRPALPSAAAAALARAKAKAAGRQSP